MNLNIYICLYTAKEAQKLILCTNDRKYVCKKSFKTGRIQNSVHTEAKSKIYTETIPLKSLGLVLFFHAFERILLCSPGLHLFDQKLQLNSEILQFKNNLFLFYYIVK